MLNINLKYSKSHDLSIKIANVFLKKDKGHV